eukprot:gene3238-biopygen18703
MSGRPASLARQLPPPPGGNGGDTASYTLPQETTFGGRELRESRRKVAREIIGAGPRTGTGAAAFEFWGPKVLNEIHGIATAEDPEAEGYDTDTEEPLPERERKGGHPPEDEYKQQRAAYYAWISEKYAGPNELQTGDGRINVWVDGSAIHVEGFPSKAGAGIFYGESNSLNCGVPVTGKHTNQRAELTALLHVLKHELRPVLILTDSMYVHGGVTTWRHTWRASAWMRSPTMARRVPNSDPWKQVDRLMNRRGNSIQTQWVKAHAMPWHIKAGLTTELDI